MGQVESTRAGGRDWHVVTDYDNRAAAAQMLARLNTAMLGFIARLRIKYAAPDDNNLISRDELHNIVEHLAEGYNPAVFYESDPRTTSETSYTVNKGRAMYLCLRDRANPQKLVDYNTMMFVMLHESSHIANYRTFGHDQFFWSTFKFILHEAVLAKIYAPVNYALAPIDYCGLTISENPLYDTQITELSRGGI